jgi:hypothetical protein
MAVHVPPVEAEVPTRRSVGISPGSKEKKRKPLSFFVEDPRSP